MLSWSLVRFNLEMFIVKDSVLQGLCSCVIYKFFVCMAVMLATLVRPLATSVHMLVNTSCQTGLHMFTATCSHLGTVTTLVLQNVSQS